MHKSPQLGKEELRLEVSQPSIQVYLNYPHLKGANETTATLTKAENHDEFVDETWEIEGLNISFSTSRTNRWNDYLAKEPIATITRENDDIKIYQKPGSWIF